MYIVVEIISMVVYIEFFISFLGTSQAFMKRVWLEMHSDI